MLTIMNSAVGLLVAKKHSILLPDLKSSTPYLAINLWHHEK